MINNDTLTPAASDRFSWRRVGLVARYYYKSLKRSLIVFPLLSLAAGLFTFLSYRYEISFLFSGLLSTILSFLYYWSPLIFNRAESSQLTLSLPCRWTERATFVVLFAVIGLPILIFVPQYALSELGQYIFSDNYTSLLQQWNVSNDMLTGSVADYLLKFSMAFLPFTVTLFIVFKARKSRTLKGILLSVAALIGQSIIYGVAVAITIYSNIDNGIFDGHPTNIDVESFRWDAFMNLNLITGIGLTAVALMFVVLTIRRFKTVQIA